MTRNAKTIIIAGMATMFTLAACSENAASDPAAEETTTGVKIEEMPVTEVAETEPQSGSDADDTNTTVEPVANSGG